MTVPDREGNPCREGKERGKKKRLLFPYEKGITGTLSIPYSGVKHTLELLKKAKENSDGVF